MTALCSAPAHAGHWVFTTTGSGQSTLNGNTQRTYTAPSTTTSNSVSTGYALSASGSYGPGTGTGPPVTVTATANLTLTVTAVWTADGNSDDTQPPPGIWFSEDTTANGTFSNNNGPAQASTMVDDGFQDPVVQSGSSIGTSAKVHYVKSSGNTVTTTLTASVTAKGTTGAAGGAGAVASVGPITIAIHAQPYNYHKVPGGGNMGVDGSLSFTYDWSSTTGNKNDLTTCFWHEYVLYPGTAGTAANPNLYSPPSPPFSTFAYPNPTVSPGTGMSGGAMTGTNQVVDTQGVPPFVPPSLYTYGTFTAMQVYEFDDTDTGQTNVQIPGPDSGLFSILREFKLYDPHHYIYTCTKDSHTAFILKQF